MRRSRMKQVSYVLQVTCDKIPEMNEKEFLDEIRRRIYDPSYYADKQFKLIGINGSSPRVSVIRRVEEYINPAKESSK